MVEDDFIDFGNGLSSRVKGSGWSFQEDGFTWTSGDAAVLNLPARAAGETGRLMLAVHPMTYPGLQAQRVGVSVGGQRVADLVASGDCVLEVQIPAALSSLGEMLSVVLHLPDATTPTQAGQGNDDRRLGLAVAWVRWCGEGSDAVEHVGAKTVLLVAGRQVAALSGVFNRLDCLQGSLSLVACAPSIGEVRRAIQGFPKGRLSAIWLQRTLEGPSPESLREVVGDTPIASFPALSMELLWPFAGPDPRLAAEPPLYPQGRYPFSDSLGARVAAENIAEDDVALQRYMALSQQQLPDFGAALGAYAEVLRTRDEECTIPLSGFILAEFQSTQLFHSPSAPTGALMTHLAYQLAVHGGVFSGALLGAVLLELDRLMAGYLGVWHQQLPVHPTIAAAYHLRWHDAGARYRWFENEWRFEDYTLNYIRWASWAL